MRKNMKTFLKISAVFACTVAALVLSAGAWYFAVTANVRLESDKFQPAQKSAEVFDGDGNEIAEVDLFSEHRSVTIGEVPEHVRQAFISAEDRNFYKHKGLDYKGMVRAALKNLKARSFKQGASTISQQLVKNTQLSGEKTLRRKMKEIRLTRQLEKKYSKDEILEMYLNTIYFGHTCYGIAEAADFYFEKEVKDLSLAEGAMLAAVIRSPNNYSPFVDKKACLRVRNKVLQAMLSLNKITQKEYESAKAQPLPQQGKTCVSSDNYIDAVCDELQSLPLFSPYKLRGAVRIYTYMDRRMQEFAEQLSTTADRSGKSLILCDNKSSGVCAWFTTEGNLRRQPGSAIKPLAVYGPAIEENLISPCTPVCDEPTSFGDYTPGNYNDHYYGWVSARQALAQSLNIPAVRILNELGTEKSVRYLKKMGLPVTEQDKNLSLALGGMTEGFTLPELSGAYMSLANNGTFSFARFIRKIESEDGETLYTREKENVRAFSSDTVTLVNEMLEKAVKDGTAKKLKDLPFEVCAKTGTCGKDNGNTDAWTLAYTSAHTVGVWMGNADNTLTDVTGGGLPCHYANLLLSELYKKSAPAPFDKDRTLVTKTLDKTSYVSEHILRLAAPAQPKGTTIEEKFRASNCPLEMSTIYQRPAARAELSVQNTTVIIHLCQTEYYAFEIKRTNNGIVRTIFSGNSDGIFYDKILKRGEKYFYSVRPYYTDDAGNRVYGEEISLPLVCIPKQTKRPPADWWHR